jgi:hypothetical protein
MEESMFIYLIEVTELLVKRGPAKNRPKDGGSAKCVRSHNLESAAGTLCRRLGYPVKHAEISERKRVDQATFTGVLKKKGRYDEEYVKVATVKVSQVKTKGGE